MRVKVTDPSSAPNMGSYSPAVRMGEWLFVSGQGPIDSSGQIIGTTIEEQTHQTMQNIRKLVHAAGATMSQVARCTCHLATINDFAAFDRVYRGYFEAPYPARTTVGSELPEILVEIDAMVWLGPTEAP